MPAATITPPDSLPEVLQWILHVMDREPPDSAFQLPGAEPSWQKRLDRALPTVGLSARWLEIPPSGVAAQVRRDLPLVTWLDGPTGGRWVLARSTRWGRVKLEEPGGVSGWVDLEPLMGSSPRSWARIVPVLPASPLDAGRRLPRTPTRRLLALLHAERSDIGVVVVFAVAIGLLSLATPIAIQLLINWLAFGALLQPIITLGIALLFCLTLVGILRAAQRHAVEVVQRRLFARTVADLSARLARVRLHGFDGAYGPELANRFFDVLTLQKAANTLLLDGLAATLQAAVGMLLLAFYHPLLLVFDIVVVVMVVIVLVPLARGAEASAIIESKKKYAVAAWLEELARHPLVFKFGGSDLATNRTDKLTAAYLGARSSHFHVFMRQYLGMQVVTIVLPAALLVMCGWLVLEGQLTLGQLVAAEFIVASALAGVSKFTEKLETVYDLLAGVDKLGALFDLPLERMDGAIRDRPDEPATLKLEGLMYQHDGAHAGIGPIDLQVKAGERLAIVGAPGSGKSTLAEVMLGLRTLQGGSLSLDGIPLKSLRPANVQQEFLRLGNDDLLVGTVRDNLVLGRSVPDALIWDALEAVGIAEEVRRRPEGLETFLHPPGAPFSRTQARGFMVARALLLRPRLLVVNGLLDGIPAKNAQVWRALLVAPTAPWTLILFTHDPVTAACCPTVLTLREGALHA